MQQTIQSLLQQNAKLIDVRTPQEFASQAVKGSVNIPLQELPHRLQECGNPSEPIIVFCASGGRSQQAMYFLQNNGYNNVVNAGSYLSLLNLV